MVLIVCICCDICVVVVVDVRNMVEILMNVIKKVGGWFRFGLVVFCFVWFVGFCDIVVIWV